MTPEMNRFLNRVCAFRNNFYPVTVFNQSQAGIATEIYDGATTELVHQTYARSQFREFLNSPLGGTLAIRYITHLRGTTARVVSREEHDVRINVHDDHMVQLFKPGIAFKEQQIPSFTAAYHSSGVNVPRFDLDGKPLHAVVLFTKHNENRPAAIYDATGQKIS